MTRNNFPGGPRATSGSRARAAALIPGALLALLLCAGEAAAQTAVCSNAPAANQRIECEVASGTTEDIDIDAESLAISTTTNVARGVHANHQGAGGLAIDLDGGSVTTTGDSVEGVRARRAGAGDISITTRNLAVSTGDMTRGTGSAGVLGLHAGDSGDVSIEVHGGSIRTRGSSAPGVSGRSSGAGGVRVVLRDVESETAASLSYGVFGESAGGALEIDVQDGSVTTGGASAVWGAHTGSDRIEINVADAAVSTTGANGRGVVAYHTGDSGDAAISVRGGSVTTEGAASDGVLAWRPSGAGDLSISLSEDARVAATGRGSRGVFANHTGVSGAVSVDLAGARVSARDSYGVYARHRTGDGDMEVRVRGGSIIETDGISDYGVLASHSGGTGGVSVSLSGDAAVSTLEAGAYGIYASHSSSAGDLSVSLSQGASIETAGGAAYGILAWRRGADSEANIVITAADASVETTGGASHGVYAYNSAASGGVSIDLTGARVSARAARGVYARRAAGDGDIEVRVRGGPIETAGAGGYGVLAYGGGTGGASVSLSEGASISTRGGGSHGVYAFHAAAAGGAVSVNLNGAAASTRGDDAYGVYGRINGASNEADLSIDLAGGSVSTEGLAASGVFGRHEGQGAVSISADAESAIKTPFGVGAEGRLENDANASGCVLVAHAGEIEARAAGVIAWAQRSSGHTFGEGAQTADDAARTAPMVHVVSGGDMTVGDGVMDAFIRSRIAGADGALSAGERAVLSAIEAGDSEALDAAFAALPESYDEAYWETRELLRKRGGAAESAPSAARAAANDILGVPDAGIGIAAWALSHYAVAHHVRGGDRDPAILAKEEASRTPGEQAALAEQELLSARERRVLEAALTGGDLEAALAALPAAYADDWKNEVRALALSYNAGDVRVEVTGGAIAADGDGVHARFTIPHERNGAVSVSVARGAVVSGGRNGLYLSGAGAGDGNFLAQSVSVDGAVAGGTGAGVYMRGGGRLMVGETGRISAESGAGVLSDGPGDFAAAIAGVVEGDVRGTGSGEHTVAVSPGGEVTGTIHLSGSAVTLGGAAGAVRLDLGGTVSVSAGSGIRGAGGTAIRAGGAPLLFDLDLNDARGRPRWFRQAMGGRVIIHNARGATDIFVNRTQLHDGETGGTGAVVHNGARDLSLLPGAGDDGIFTADEFIERYAPHAGVYEALPGLLLRMESGRARAERTTAPGLPVWVRLRGAGGARGTSRSTSAARYDFDSTRMESGLAFSFPWREGLAGSLSVQYQRASAETSMTDGKGRIDLEGVGLGAGLSWENGSGWRLRGEFSVMDYDADLASGKWGNLRSDVDASVRVLDIEAARRFAPVHGLALSPRVRLTRSAISMDGFTDILGARFSLARAKRLTGSAGAVAETARPMRVRGGTLDLRASLDAERILNGAETTVAVADERLRAEARRTRLLLGVGARWCRGRF